MNKKFIIEYWANHPEDFDTIEVPTREEADDKQGELAEEGFGSVIREVRI